MKSISDSAVERLRVAIDQPVAGERYLVGDLLGRGGMGAVYRAFDKVLERDVALKALSIEADADEIASRLTREARVLAHLEHPGIVAVHDAGALDDGRPFYVMRLVKGKRLDEYAKSAGRGDLLRAFLRICDAVGYAHARDVIHRDLTPANVMVGEFGDVLVLDWGVAKIGREEGAARISQPRLDDVTTADGIVVGTPGFMAPEQASGSAATADSRADIYGLGAILKFLAGSSNEKIPRPLGAIIDRATAIDPAFRYAAVADLADDVRHWMDGEPIGAYRERAFERIGRLYRRNQALVLLLIAYAVMRIAILLWRGV